MGAYQEHSFFLGLLGGISFGVQALFAGFRLFWGEIAFVDYFCGGEFSCSFWELLVEQECFFFGQTFELEGRNQDCCCFLLSSVLLSFQKSKEDFC